MAVHFSSTQKSKFRETGFTENNFVENFFSLSKKCDNERSNSEIVNLLKEFALLGYTLNEKKVVFGNRLGVFWPCLERPGAGSYVAVGSATGHRGGFGIGVQSLEDYLRSQKQVITTHETQQKTFSKKNEQKCDSPKLSERTSKTQNINASTSKSTELTDADHAERFSRAFNTISVSGVPFQSLKNFQSQGFFLEIPIEELNSLTVDDLLNTSLSIYQEGSCLIKKNHEILACTPGLAINTPSFEYCGKKMYEHQPRNGKSISSDDPCDLPKAIDTKLKDPSVIKEILPYLRGLTLYKEDK
jgi:hypothetical protein